ncbi:response regulator [Pedobacter sp. Du54]|uniref:response regulator n=1 Tax=Pedobacter anseongensis TaxID=3133439 RepID=UPI00309CBCB7
MRILSSLNTYYRLLVLIIGTSALFFILYGSLYFYTLKQEKAVYKSTLMEYENEINSIFQLNAKSHNSSNYYVSFWTELVEFTKTKDQSWYKEFIESEFESYQVDFLGVYDLNNQLISKTATPKVNSGNFIPKEAFQSLYKEKIMKFYLKVPEGIAEVYGATIHPTDDPKRNKYPPAGYFIMMRLVDKDFIKNLEEISSSTITIVQKDPVQNEDRNLISVNLNLNNWKNENIADLQFTRSFTLNFSNTKKILNIIVIATLLNLLIYLYYYKKWVYWPIKLITNILERKDEKSISSLKKSRDEFGHIGNLFEENNNQRKQLVIAKEKAEESDKLKSSFLANLSHEIRTPMNAIMGFSDLLRDGTLNEAEKANYLKIIRNSGSNLIGIIEDLIEMSKIDSLQIVPNYKSINLDKCISELYSSIKITIPEEKEVSFTIQKNQKTLEKNILTDEIKFKQILTNLITNAIKFTNKGYVTVGYTVDEIQESVKIWVEDTGLGIDEDNQKIIFDRFRRIEDDFTIAISGLGLGLSITKAYVELLGGTVSVTSTPGKGSIFSFTIPLKYEEPTEENIKLKQAQKGIGKGNETILIAEDDDINFLLLERILQLKNYSIIRATNGKEAVEICEANPEIDLVFMDIKMPVMNGFDAFDSIRKSNLNMPIIANTAYSSSEDKEQIKKAGFTDYISKPLNKAQIHQLLDGIFGG